MDANQRREIILKHYQNPVHRGLVSDETYRKADTSNESCIDEVHLMAKLENGRIVDLRFDGEACAMCTSSTSLMIQTLIGKTLEEAEVILQQFEAMIEGEEYDANVLEDTIAYDDIAKQPNRKKCVLLPWWGLEKILNEEKEGKQNER